MKLKDFEIGISSFVLLTNVYGLLSTVNPTDLDWPNPAFITNVLPGLLMYLTYYLSFLWVACSLPNRYISARNWNKASLSLLAGFILTIGLFAICRYLPNQIERGILWESQNRALGQAIILYPALLLYQALKQSVLWLTKYEKAADPKNPIIAESAYFTINWTIFLTGCILLKAYWGVTLFLALVVPCAFAVYVLNVYWLLPRYYKKENLFQFWMLELGISLCVNIPLNGFYSAKATYSPGYFLLLFSLIWALQLVLVFPMSIYIFRKRKELMAEMTGLKNNLGSTNANLQLLKSQINPHFLFNSLNTLYGMALAEKSEKTAEAIQQLGDMMHFMLEENVKDNIPLEREMEYLKNYLALQNLRIAESPNVEITAHIQECEPGYYISPMLLIPFIENAYKHGISLRERSWIHISISLNENTLFFDLHNSIHSSRTEDPERHRSGIGLENVKQRLRLLYPDKHDLLIRKTTSDYFIHLNINLR